MKLNETPVQIATSKMILAINQRLSETVSTKTEYDKADKCRINCRSAILVSRRLHRGFYFSASIPRQYAESICTRAVWICRTYSLLARVVAL